MKPYIGKADSKGPVYPNLNLIQLSAGDIDSGLFKGKELGVDAGGSQPSWVVIFDDLTTAYRMPPSEKEEKDLFHIATSGPEAVYIEAPFGSYRPPNRLTTVQAMENGGVLFFFLDSKYTTRSLRAPGRMSPRKGNNCGWTNAEAAVAITNYAQNLKALEDTPLKVMTVERFTRDHTERNLRRQKASQLLKNDRRNSTDFYAGHAERAAQIAGKFRDKRLEEIALSSQVALATMYYAAKFSPTQNDIDDFLPREGAYRNPRGDQAGIFRSNIAWHMKNVSLKDVRRTIRAIRVILSEQAARIPNGLGKSS